MARNAIRQRNVEAEMALHAARAEVGTEKVRTLSFNPQPSLTLNPEP